MDVKQGNLIMEDIALKFLRAATQLQGNVDAQLSEHDLSLQQLKVLSVLRACDEQKAQVSFIRSQMIDPNSNVSRLLNKLMDKGLIEKRRDQTDQRVVHIHLTDAGQKAMSIGKKVMDKEFEIFSKLSTTQRNELNQMLQLLA